MPGWLMVRTRQRGVMFHFPPPVCAAAHTTPPLGVEPLLPRPNGPIGRPPPVDLIDAVLRPWQRGRKPPPSGWVYPS